MKENLDLASENPTIGTKVSFISNHFTQWIPNDNLSQNTHPGQTVFDAAVSIYYHILLVMKS